ncbi:hypothetical protein AGR3A_Lc50015 [Agrobacterium tomkonis CFBP 6623]|uniref:Uncharacterized protein n=1 Tax=Agrobacterium tomkonis CFBP 6623 TaxID=1183432 RepID=A0A1S7S5K4_9HYPH|nr:hypothetical protein ASD85_21985 [Rhizobium sp. Root651]CUX62798.1 hypothetical protein AGR3A_Lc50015 [Agrobacterium tomkonis CFBP 6623]
MDQTVTALPPADDVRAKIVTIAQQKKARDRREIALEQRTKKAGDDPPPRFFNNGLPCQT